MNKTLSLCREKHGVTRAILYLCGALAMLGSGGHGDGFGCGFGVLTPHGKSKDAASVGTFSWGGLYNTYFRVDPQEAMIGILMTQILPYDHLDLRSEFKRLAYEAVDDSGFRRRYWYEKGTDQANPYFNNRQLRVNAPSTSVHPSFASRSEARSSGMARIQIEENLREVRRADLYCEVWGGHPGTTDKRVSVNGRNLYRFPEVGTAREHCTHQYPRFNLPITDLVNGYNSLQFACDQGTTFWGHYIVDNACLEIGLPRQHPDLQEAGLGRFQAEVRAVADPVNERIRLSIDAGPGDLRVIDQVHYQARYFGYDENGNTYRWDWHGMTKNRRPYGIIGSAQQAPFEVDWDLRMIPAQDRVAVRALITFKDQPDLVFRTSVVRELSVPDRNGIRVELYQAQDLPRPFWSRADRKKSCTITLDVEPDTIEAAELHVVAWTGGAGTVEEYFQLNGHAFPVAEGSGHEVVYSRLPVDPAILNQGENRVELLSDTEHHGIEIMRPGPALMLRSRSK